MDEMLVGERVKTPSLATNSFARLLSDGSHFIFAFLIGVITARWFGPSGKGAYAVLLSAITILGHVATMGLGEASVIVSGLGISTPRRIMSVSILPIAAASVTCGALLWFWATAEMTQGPDLGQSVLVAAMCVPVLAAYEFLSYILNADERIVSTSLIRGAAQLTTFLSVVVFVVLMQRHITGGMFSVLVGTGLGLTLTVRALLRSGARMHWTIDASLLGGALRYGLPNKLGFTLAALAERVDVLLVYNMMSRADAGRYSVALTMGQLVAFASLAISFSMFPRIAKLNAQESLLLVAQASRIGLATSLVSGAALLLAIPVAVPIVFGTDYAPSTWPAMVTVFGGVMWAQQNVLARSRSARGHTSLQVMSHGVTLVTMLVADLLLIPIWGIVGAAVASLAGASAGLLVCAIAYRGLLGAEGLRLGDFLPGRADFRTVKEFLASLVAR